MFSRPILRAAAAARPTANNTFKNGSVRSMSLLPNGPDPDGLLEYSVVYTDRALSHMSKKFQGVMTDLSSTLKTVYGAHSSAIIPGCGTYGMEACARQFGTNKKVLVIRNGFFSFRWTQIFDTPQMAADSVTVLRASPVDGDAAPQYAPPPIDEVVAAIRAQKPDVVFSPHVETSAGIILPPDYVKAVGAAAHEVGAIFVLDCIASGTVFVNMEESNVDALITAPQKGWSGPACAALVMLSEKGRARVEETQSTSFSLDLKKWVQVMDTYEAGGHMYHATMGTDALVQFHEVMAETEKYGFDKIMQDQWDLGNAMRETLAARGFKSVAADGFGAPGVVVSYTDNPGFKSGAEFAARGMQIAGGVPLMLDDYTSSPDFSTFRLGLFGIDKLQNIDRCVKLLEERLDDMGAERIVA
jgi:aspartate aminotransferase-like enzyme